MFQWVLVEVTKALASAVVLFIHLLSSVDWTITAHYSSLFPLVLDFSLVRLSDMVCQFLSCCHLISHLLHLCLLFLHVLLLSVHSHTL